MEKWPPHSCSHSLHCLFSPNLYLWPHGDFPMTSQQRKRRLEPEWQTVVHKMQTSFEVNSCSTTIPLQDISEGQLWKEIFMVGRTSRNAPGCSLCVKGETASMWLYADSGFGWMVRDPRGTRLKNRWQGGLEQKYVDGPLWMDGKRRY